MEAFHGRNVFNGSGFSLVLSQEHIIALLKTYCGLAVVSWVNDRVIGQGEQSLAYPGNETVVVAVGEVSTSYAAAEQRISTEKHLLLLNVVCKTAWRMTRNCY